MMLLLRELLAVGWFSCDCANVCAYVSVHLRQHCWPGRGRPDMAAGSAVACAKKWLIRTYQVAGAASQLWFARAQWRRAIADTDGGLLEQPAATLHWHWALQGHSKLLESISRHAEKSWKPLRKSRQTFLRWTDSHMMICIYGCIWKKYFHTWTQILF